MNSSEWDVCPHNLSSLVLLITREVHDNQLFSREQRKFITMQERCACLVENEVVSPNDIIQPICTSTFHPAIL